MINSKPIEGFAIVIPAGTPASPGTAKQQCPGSFFLCRSASSPFVMQFDSGTVFPCEQGFQTGAEVGNFGAITFYNENPYSITVRYYVGAAGVGFSGTITAQNLPTYLLGNLGLSASGNYTAGGNVQAVTISVRNTYEKWIAISEATPLLVYGINAGNVRKQIQIKVSTELYKLIVKDVNGNHFTIIEGGTTQIIESAQTIQLISARGGGGSFVMLGEIYYAA